MARMPVSGVRTSCANAASAVSTMPGAAVLTAVFTALLAARLGALPAASFGARLFGGRFFGGPDRRFERDAGAMIPLTWPASPCHGRAREVTLRHGFPPAKGLQASPAARSGQADQPADIGRGRARGAEFAQGHGLRRFRQFAPFGIEDQTVMPV